MSEYLSADILEAEIAELNKEIEAKRAELESKHGVVTERGALHEVVAERLAESSPDAAALRAELQAKAAAGQTTTTGSQSGYLNALTDDQAAAVNQLVNLIPAKGINFAIAEAKKLDPFLLDAFHDALVDKLYEELAERGWVTK